MNAVL